MKVLASLPLFATANQYYGDKVSFDKKRRQKYQSL